MITGYLGKDLSQNVTILHKSHPVEINQLTHPINYHSNLFSSSPLYIDTHPSQPPQPLNSTNLPSHPDLLPDHGHIPTLPTITSASYFEALLHHLKFYRKHSDRVSPQPTLKSSYHTSATLPAHTETSSHVTRPSHLAS